MQTRTTIRLTTTAAAATLIALAGAAQAQPDMSDVTDTKIDTAVESAMQDHGAVNANRIEATVKNGIVTLEGTAKSIGEKERALTLARATTGVRAVIDEIGVEAPERKTRKLRMDVLSALENDPAVELNQFDVELRNQEVILAGAVESATERMLAERVVSSVRGVEAVHTARVVIKPNVDRGAAEVEKEVERALAANVLIDDGMIDIAFDPDSRAVTLDGAVGSAAERMNARRTAYVNGVAVVKDDLEVKPEMRESMRRDPASVARTDSELRDVVIDAIRRAPRVESDDIGVSVEDGRVTLFGEVAYLGEAKEAIRAAEQTVGTRQVKSLIKIDMNEGIDDPAIEYTVNEAFGRSPLVQMSEINVEAADGEVTLTGDVPNDYIKSRATVLAANVPGVVGVDNRLDAAREWERRPDAQIREEINDEFFWSPFVDGGDINVGVEDGVVTLSGSVDSIDEFRAAEENAYEGGARVVQNRLMIEAM